MSNIELIDSNGKIYYSPPDKVEEALASGFFKKVEADQPQVKNVEADQPQVKNVEADQPDQPLSKDIIPEEKDINEEISPAVVSPPTITMKDIKTGENVEIPEGKEANRAVLSGTHTVSDLPLIGEDQKLYDSPSEDATRQALQSGHFRLSTLQERQNFAQHKAIEQEVEHSGLTGLKPIVGSSLDAILGFAGKHTPFYQIASETNKNPEFQAAGEQAFSQVSKENPIASNIGAAAGELGSIYSSGQIAGAASTALKATGLAKIGLEGAIYSAEPVIKSLINDKPMEAAENLAIGIGVNWGLHKLIGAAPEILGAIKSKTSALMPEMSQEVFENTMGKKMGMTPSQIAKERSSVIPAIKAANITEKDSSSVIADKIRKLEESGSAIGEAYKKLDTLEGKESLIEDASNRLKENLRAKYIPEIVAKEADEAAIKAAAPELQKGMQEELIKKYGTRVSIDEAASQKALQPILDRIDDTARRGTFTDVRKLITWIGEQANWKTPTTTDFDNLYKGARNVAKEAFMPVENQAALKLGDPEIIKGLEQDRGLYHFYKLLEHGAEVMASKVQPDIGHSVGIVQRHGLPAVLLHMLGVPAQASLAVSVAAGLGKKYLQNAAIKRGFNKFIEDSAHPATDIILHASQQQSKVISDNVKELLKNFVSTKAPPAIVGSHNAIKDFLPNGGVGQTSDQQLKELQQMISESSNNPEILIHRLSKVNQPLIDEGLPEVAEAYTQHQIRLMKVIQTVLPQDTSMTKAHPFSANVKENEISEATKAKYQRALSIASDPVKLLQMIKDNTLTQSDVAIAAATNPLTLQKIRNALINEGLESKPDLSYQHRLSLGVIMGENLDESTDQLPVLQSAYSLPSSLPSPSSSHKSNHSLSNNAKTVSQTSQGH